MYTVTLTVTRNDDEDEVLFTDSTRFEVPYAPEGADEVAVAIGQGALNTAKLLQHPQHPVMARLMAEFIASIQAVLDA